MASITLSSREFNQDASRAKKAALNGTVFITDRGKPAHVLMSIEAYRKLVSDHASIMDLLPKMEPMRSNLSRHER